MTELIPIIVAAAAAGAILLIALGEFLALSYIIVRPMGIISRSIRGSVTGDGKIASDIPLQSGDEFGDLAQQFNSLRTELNSANARLQSKIDAADHKLLETNQKLLKQSLELKLMNKELQQLSITDALTGLGERFRIRSIPTMAVFQGGREVARTSGAMPAAQIEAFVRGATGAA